MCKWILKFPIDKYLLRIDAPWKYTNPHYTKSPITGGEVEIPYADVTFPDNNIAQFEI